MFLPNSSLSVSQRNITHQETGEEYSSDRLIGHRGVDVDDREVVDSEEQQQEKPEYMRPNIHRFVRPPEYAETNILFSLLSSPTLLDIC